MADDDELSPSGDPLLAAKFAVPPVPPAFVARKRLTDRLTEGTRGPLTVITGPAGAGKTTLATSWLHQSRRQRAQPPAGPVVWLTVEHDDSAPGVFWAYVLGAFRYHRVPLPDGVGSPSRPDSVDHALIVRLASALTRLDRPVVLVLDGFEQAADRDVAADLDFLLTHSGTSLRLVLTGRVDPPLPLHRYRTDARSCEIRRSELAFTARETGRLLQGHGLTASPESVAVLTERTEGWAAGLRLCALAMQQTDDAEDFARSFAASQHAVADYLMAEVLDAQPPGTQELLIRTSILTHIHPELADALTGRDDAGRTLGRLAAGNAFLEPVGDTSWYRSHPLFAEVLRAHLRSRSPALGTELHRTAAHWLAGHDRLTEALEHAVAADDWAYATALLVDRLAIGRLLTGPDSHGLQQLFSALPADLPGAAPALVAAAVALAGRDTKESRRLLEASPVDDDAALEPRLTHALLRLLTDAATGPDSDGDAAQYGGGDGASADDVRALMAQLPLARREEHPEIEALYRYGRAQALLATGRRAEARDAFAAALPAATDERTRTVRYHCLGALALTEAVDGLPGAAEAHAREGLDTAEQHGIAVAGRTPLCQLALAVVALDRGDLQGAARHLDAADAADACPSALDPLATAEAAVLHARLDLAHGRTSAALTALTGFDDNGTHDPCAEAEHRTAMARSAVHLARGDTRAARTALRAGAPGSGPACTVAAAAVQLAAGDPERARRLLAPLGEGAPLCPADEIRRALLLAQAAVGEEDTPAAVAFLDQALRAARPGLLRAPFDECGPWLRHLLARAPELAATHPWLTKRPTADDGCAPLIERLSARECDVLRCAAQLMSTQEIAAEMFLSVNTVKTHLKSVYRKLSVSHRGEAVRRAREAGLL
ncbi:LuxR C-terminal-related transcriptional regulator [Streptomyces sp. NPDC007861]|uniref:LuxR C-terminal-related transcriptional regulator n=1 Tax=Streptomyces sp. NPDC007861 TaxID=3154893 RepID=UPI0033C6320A